ncbi:MAG: hypothetical protein RJB09_1421 [Pseudomonadota bacterium]
MPASAGQDQRDGSALKCLRKKQKSGFDPKMIARRELVEAVRRARGCRGLLPANVSAI